MLNMKIIFCATVLLCCQMAFADSSCHHAIDAQRLMSVAKTDEQRFLLGKSLFDAFYATNSINRDVVSELSCLSLIRGPANLITGPAELFRNIVKDDELGLFKGLSSAIQRSVSGVIDFVSLGTLADRLYCESRPPWIWNSDWSFHSCKGTFDGALFIPDDIVGIVKSPAESGHPEAQMLLGDCFRLGVGVTKNIQEAAAWYKRAAENGNKDARSKLQELRGF